MSKLILLAFLAACASNSATPASKESPATGSECQVDTDCACGKDRTTGQCAWGPASKIDTAQQCPDFCTGIGGQFRIVCAEGKCQQAKR